MESMWSSVASSEGKRCQEPFPRRSGCFLGRPWGRSVLSKPSRWTIWSDHAGSPNGLPRCTLATQRDEFRLRLRPLHGLFQDLLEGGVIRVALEDRHPRIRAVQHVVNQPPIRVSFRSSHVASLPRRRPFGNNGA